MQGALYSTLHHFQQRFKLYTAEKVYSQAKGLEREGKEQKLKNRNWPSWTSLKGAASPGSCPVPETRRKAQVVLPLVSYHMQYDFADSWILSYQWLLQVTLAEIGLWRCVSSQRNRRMGLGSQPHELLWVRLVQSCQKGRERVFKGSTKTANHSSPFHGKYEKKMNKILEMITEQGTRYV